MLVVLHVCNKDIGLAALGLELAITMEKRAGTDGKVDFPCLLAYDDRTNPAPIEGLVAQYFREVKHLQYTAWGGEGKWPQPQNWAWQQVAWHIFNNKIQSPWFWWEPDAIPLRPGWLDDLAAEYARGKRPFMGHVVAQQGHMAGVGIYPWNVCNYTKQAFLVSGGTSWDIAMTRETSTQTHRANNLIQHVYGKGGVTIDDMYSFDQMISASHVLFHPCKDGSLPEFLLTSRGISKSATPFKKTETPIVVQRTGAIGDAIMALPVAKKLHQRGFEVYFATANICAEAMGKIPYIRKFIAPNTPEENGAHKVDLDGVYENHPDRRKKHKSVLFLESAKQQLNGHIRRGFDSKNIAPQLEVLQDEEKAAFLKIESYPKPWVMVCPRSDFWPNRTVPDAIWQKAAAWHKVEASGDGTWFWTGTSDAPKEFVDLRCRTIREVASYLRVADVVATVDTGPMHIAAALGVPLVVIFQSSSPELHLTDQRDYTMISPSLGCLNCQLRDCPINKDDPPCRQIDPSRIADAVKTKLETRYAGKVSAIIPVWKPNVERLNRCLKHTLPQVDEVIISIDGDGQIPPGITQVPKVRFVQNPHGERMGFGKTVNRATRQAIGQYLLLLNDDVFLNPNAVQKMREAMTAGVGVVGCRLWYPDRTIQHGGCTRGVSDVGWGHIDHRAKKPTITTRTEMESVTFAAALVCRKAYFEILGFDEAYDCYYEDNDFCLGVRQRGYKVIYEPSAEGIHEESQTSSPMKQELAAASAKVFEAKWRWYFEKNPPGKLGTFQ